MMNKVIFYILSLTWGLPMTLVGAVCSLFLLLMGHKPKTWRGCVCFEVGKDFGGVNFGMFFITEKNGGRKLKNHEYGHAVQNCILGIFMPFAVSIPSAVRYWWRRIKKPNTAYDSIWFEKWATKIGERGDTACG